MRNRSVFIKKILLLVSVMTLMLTLCGCRTRLTNNKDVSSVYNDQNGILQESYEMRRDELNLSVAEAPILPQINAGEDADEEYDYDDGFDYEEQDPEDWDTEDEDFDEDEDEDEDDGDSSSSSSTSSSSTSSSSSRTQTTTRPGTTTRRTVVTTAITVKLDPNGKGAKSTRTSIIVRKGSTYIALGSVPDPTRSGYSFLGWYTQKSKGSKVTSKTKVTKGTSHTLYAHWKKSKKEKKEEKPEEPKEFTVTFDGNGDGAELSSSTITVTENGTYGDLPTPKREKYKFDGWYTAADGGSKIEKGSKFTANSNQTLYAHWDDDAYNWWKEKYDKAANGEKGVTFYLKDGEVKSLIKAAKGESVSKEDSPDYAITVGKLDKAEEIASDLLAEFEGADEDDVPTIIVLPKDADASDNKELLYKMLLLNEFYGKDLDADEAAGDLGEDSPQIFIY